MKKVLSVILSFLLIVLSVHPVFAAVKDDEIVVASSKSIVPVIRILGDGEPLYDAEGNRLYHHLSNILGDNKDESGDSDIYESIANVLMPFLKEGLLMNNWEPYYENLQKEIGEITGDSKLDNNGNPLPGTGLSPEKREYMATAATKNQGKKGYFGINDYRFWYDWRLDPIDTAAQLHEYIQAIKKITGKDKVAIVASCIGTIITTTYVALYGVEDIHGIAYTGSVATGAEMLSEVISGKFYTDSYSIQRFIDDCNYIGVFNLNEFINTTLELVLKTGIVEGAIETIRMTLYDKLVHGVTSALALSTFFTYPSYWAAVTNEDYENAMLHVFGETGSAKRTEYAGLISRIENYHNTVRVNLDSIIRSIGEGGANFGAIVKYGFQIMPICESSYAVADEYVSVKRASFGATTANIFETLTEDYIAKRTNLGYGKYISPDKQIDASTCIYPDSTWFVKNSHHSNYTKAETKLLYDVATAPKQLSIDDFEYTQFMVYNYETTEMHAMTEENCSTEQWKDDKPSESIKEKLNDFVEFFKTFYSWIRLLFDMLFN